MRNIYYTAKEGRRNVNGHTTTRGTVYVVECDQLSCIGEYVHQSGGAGIESAILRVAEEYGINTNGGYYSMKWRDAVSLNEL